MPHEGIHIGWMAMPTHADSFEALRIRATLEHLLQRHAHLSITGVGLDLKLRSRRYIHAEGIPYGLVAQSLAHFDVAIAPLADTATNQARSDIKLKEYAIAGVPWLASDYGPYVGYGEDQGGRLVRDDEWFDALNGLLSDGKAQRKLAKRGQKWAKDQTLERNAPLWAGALQQAIDLAEQRSGARA